MTMAEKLCIAAIASAAPFLTPANAQQDAQRALEAVEEGLEAFTGQPGRTGRGQGGGVPIPKTVTHTIVVTSRGIAGDTNYSIYGGGDLEKAGGTLDGFDVSINAHDQMRGRTRVEGYVSTAADGYYVYGPMPQVDLQRPGNANVYINGRLMR
jgi:hypothetical protein